MADNPEARELDLTVDITKKEGVDHFSEVVEIRVHSHRGEYLRLSSQTSSAADPRLQPLNTHTKP